MRRHLIKRNRVIIVISVVCVLAAGLYAWQSLRAWSGYESRLMKEQAQYQQLKDTALQGDSTKKRLAAIRTLDDKLATRADLCKISPLYSWQSVVIPKLRDGVKECEAKLRQLGRVAVPLHALREYLEAGEKIQHIVASLNPGEALTEDNWTVNGLERAKRAATDLKALRLTGDAAKLKEQAIELSETLVSGWQSLIKANDVKDKAAFVSASAAVTKAYAGYMGLADTADTQLKQQLAAVMKEADKL